MSAPAPVPHAPTPLTDIGQLVANLPAILGFYPVESVVAMLLSHQTDRQYGLGPVVRTDLADAAHLIEIITDIINPTDICLVLIVSEDDRTVDTALEAITTRLGHLIEGVWHCREITEGEPLALLHGPAVPDVSEWHETTIPALHAATATSDLLHRGGHVALTREEAHQTYAPVPLPTGQRMALDEAAQAVEDRLLAISDTEQGEIQSLVAEVRAGLEEMPASTDHRDVDVELLALACALAGADDLDVRDLMLGEVIDHPEAGAVLTHAVGVYGSDTLIRVTGLTSHALSVMAAGGPRQAAQAALTVARETAPHHGLTRLVHGALTSGTATSQIVECVMDGVSILRQRYGIDS